MYKHHFKLHIFKRRILFFKFRKFTITVLEKRGIRIPPRFSNFINFAAKGEVKKNDCRPCLIFQLRRSCYFMTTKLHIKCYKACHFRLLTIFNILAMSTKLFKKIFLSFIYFFVHDSYNVINVLN